MTEYFFSKYYVERDCTSYGEYRESEWEFTGRKTNPPPIPVTRNIKYRFDPYDGTFTITSTGDYGTLWEGNPRATWYGVDRRTGYLLKEEFYYVNETTVRQETFQKRAIWKDLGETCRDVRGSYIGTVKGTLNQYPRNGVQGGYWYVRGGLAQSPFVISPNTGDVVSFLTDIEWDTSTPVPEDLEDFYIQISLDGGEEWEDVFRLGQSGYLTGKLKEYNFNKFGQTSQAKLRVFFTANGEMTTPTETQGVFTIIPNVPPERPERMERELYFQNIKSDYKFMWTFVDNDIPQGDYQTKAEIIVERGGKEVKRYIHESEREYFMIPLRDFEPGYEYDITVYTYDRMGLKSYFGSLRHVIFITNKEYVAEITGHEVLTDKTLNVFYKADFERDRGLAYLYNEKGEELESVPIYNDDELFIEFTTELENLKRYKVKANFYGKETDKNGEVKTGKAIEIEYELLAMYQPPPKPKITWEPTDRGILLKPELIFVEGEPEPVRAGVMKYVNGEWITLSENVDGTYEDRFAKSGKTLYRAIAFDAEGSFALSDSIEADFHLEFPVITNLRTFESLRVTDIVKFEYNNKPDTAYHRILSRNSLLAEVGEYVERRISMSWEVYDIPNLLKFREFLNSEDLFLFRDKEGRYLRISVEDYVEEESYNPHMFTLSLEGINVGEV